jgi:hypothetical protein
MSRKWPCSKALFPMERITIKESKWWNVLHDTSRNVSNKGRWTLQFLPQNQASCKTKVEDFPHRKQTNVHQKGKARKRTLAKGNVMNRDTHFQRITFVCF